LVLGTLTRRNWDQSVVWLVLFTGGIHSPIIIWLTPPPLIAGVLIG